MHVSACLKNEYNAWSSKQLVQIDIHLRTCINKFLACFCLNAHWIVIAAWWGSGGIAFQTQVWHVLSNANLAERRLPQLTSHDNILPRETCLFLEDTL